MKVESTSSIADAMSCFLASELSDVRLAIVRQDVARDERDTDNHAHGKRSAKQTHGNTGRGEKEITRSVRPKRTAAHRISQRSPSESTGDNSEADSISSNDASETSSSTSANPGRSRACRRARRETETTKPSRRRNGSSLQSKDGARQRLKCLCKQYLNKFKAHPSTCIDDFLECKFVPAMGFAT